MSNPVTQWNTPERNELPRAQAPEGRAITFGPFVVLPASRTLLCNGHPVDLGGRAFDLLIVLLRSRGDIVAKEEIVRTVWPSTIVEESNLRFQMARLRKALGKDRALIKTVAGRGYLFIADDDQAEFRTVGVPLTSVSNDQVVRTRIDRPVIFIVEADDRIRLALQRLLQPIDVKIEYYASVEALLHGSTSNSRVQARGAVSTQASAVAA